MEVKLKSTVLEIDKEIRRHEWFDFHIFSYDGFKLIVSGSMGLTYFHKLEIIFEDVFFVSGVFQGWHTDTSTIAFRIPDNEIEMNKKYEIEQGYQLFIFKAEDYSNDIIVAAKNVFFNTDTVYYYDRPNLKENERVADFVKNRKGQ